MQIRGSVADERYGWTSALKARQKREKVRPKPNMLEEVSDAPCFRLQSQNMAKTLSLSWALSHATPEFGQGMGHEFSWYPNSEQRDRAPASRKRRFRIRCIPPLVCAISCSCPSVLCATLLAPVALSFCLSSPVRGVLLSSRQVRLSVGAIPFVTG